MKKAVLTSLSLVSSLALAATPCDVWEYARLKDSTEKELVEHTCVSQKNKMENISEEFALIGSMAPNGLRDAERVRLLNAVCVDQVKAAMSVHLKKFGKPIIMDKCRAAKAEAPTQ